MNILDIFYKEIIEEVANGKVVSGFTYNILFDTYLKEDNKIVKGNIDGLISPLLIINRVCYKMSGILA